MAERITEVHLRLPIRELTSVSNYIYLNEQQFYIDTCFTNDCGWETMIFKSVDGEVVDWLEVYCERYSNRDDAYKQHKYICDHIDIFVKEK